MSRLRGARYGGFVCSRNMEKPCLSHWSVQLFIGSFRKKDGGTALRGGKRNEVRPGTLHALHQPRVVGLKLLEKYFFFFQNPKKRRKKQQRAARSSQGGMVDRLKEGYSDASDDGGNKTLRGFVLIRKSHGEKNSNVFAEHSRFNCMYINSCYVCTSMYVCM